jgi:hypothetical protein
MHLLPESPGDRTITINGLAEGTNYLIHLMFLREDGTPITSMGIQLSIPLSPEKWKLLKSATELHEDRSKALRKDVQEYLRHLASFDELMDEGMAEIKSKNLDSDEEKERITDFKDWLKWRAGKHGMKGGI